MKPIILDYTKDTELFSQTAKEWADLIYEAGHNDKNKKTQLRNFYEKVLELYEKSKKESFENVLPFVKMLNSKVAYAKSRKHVTDEFVEMMNQCISQIQTVTDLEKFKYFFEALLGFYKGK